MKATEIGIDLGRYDIKIAMIKEVNPGSKMQINTLKEFDFYPVTSKMYSDEYFSEVKAAIKDFSKKIKKNRLSLNFSLPYSDEFTKVIFMNLPMVEEKDLNLGVNFEAEQILADRPSKSYSSKWRINRKYPEINEVEVLFATLKTELIKNFSKFKTINWKVNRVVLEPLSLERFVQENDIVIDFGYEDTRLYMYKEGVLSDIHTFELGAKNVEDKLKEYVSEHKEELGELADEFNNEEDLIAELMTKVYVRNEFLDEEIEEYTEASIYIQDEIANIVDQVKVNVRSFELKNGLAIDNIYHTGGLSELKYLDLNLKSELESEVSHLNIVSKEIEEFKYEVASLVAITSKEKDKMNFAQLLSANVDYNSILVGAVTLSLSAMLVMGVIHDKYDTLIEEQQATETEQLSTLQEVENNIMNVRNSIQESEEFISKINSVTDDSYPLSDFLYVLPKLVPLKTAVTNISIKQGTITLDGYSADYSSIGFLANKLNDYGTATIMSIEDFDEKERVYSVTMENPEQVSDKYLMTKTFKIDFKYSAPLMR